MKECKKCIWYNDCKKIDNNHIDCRDCEFKEVDDELYGWGEMQHNRNKSNLNYNKDIYEVDEMIDWYKQCIKQ